MNTHEYTTYSVEVAKRILAVDSPSGYTKEVIEYIKGEYERLGFKATVTVKGALLVELGGEGNPLVLSAHCDTLGGMVCAVKGNGNLRIRPIGGLQANNTETENCRVRTRNGKVYEGTLQLDNASVHVNGNYKTTQRSFDVMEVVLDEKVSSADDTAALGIEAGDIVCFDPRTVVTASGYIKSRFLDDKLSAGILLGQAKYIHDTGRQPARKIYHLITTYEEVGHGAAAGIPEDAVEIISVDMGCVGEGLNCTEHQVSICAMDSHGPYNYDVVTALVNTAKAEGLDYAVDVYPYYGSDADVSLSAGYDVRHGLIGAGVYASHGYERSHTDGVENTLKLILAYC